MNVLYARKLSLEFKKKYKGQDRLLLLNQNIFKIYKNNQTQFTSLNIVKAKMIKEIARS